MLKIMRAWDAGKNKVRFVYRDPETNRTKIGEESFEWYFFVKKSDYEENQEMFRLLISQKKIKRCEQDKNYVRVYIDREHTSDLLNKDCEFVWEYKDHDLFEVKKLFEERNIQTYEADLLVHKRWIIDRGIEFESEFKIVGLDLETDDEKITGQMDPKTCRVLSCAVKDFNSGKEAWLCAKSRKDEHERELLLQIAKVIASYDVLAAFNGDQFDFQVLKGRFLLYGIVIDWRKKFLQDHMVIYKKLGPQLPSYSLDYIAKTVVGRGKIEHDEKIFQMFLNNRPLLREYNLEDVRLMYDIEQKTKFLAVSREVNTIGMCPCDDFYISRKIDNLILRKAYELGHYHFKTKVKQEENIEDETTFEGAFVFDPVFGLHKKVTVFDFHCLVEGTKIDTMDNGIKNIEDVVIGERLQGINRRISKVKTFNKQKYTGEVYKITLRNGLTITTTPEHKFPVVVLDKACIRHTVLKKMNEINESDRLFIPFEYMNMNGLEGDPELFEFLGIFICEGSYYEEYRKHQAKDCMVNVSQCWITIVKFEEEFKDRISYLLDKMIQNYGFPAEYEWQHKFKNKKDIQGSWRIKFKQKGNIYHHFLKEVIKWFELNLKRLESSELLQNENNLKGLMKGILEADSNVNKVRKSIVIPTTEDYRANLYEKVFSRLGIPYNHAYVKIEQRGKISYKHMFEIIHADAIHKLYKIHKYVATYKQVVFDEVNKKENKKSSECFHKCDWISGVKKIEKLQYDGFVYDIGMEDQQYPFYIANGIITKNCLYPSVIQSFNLSTDTILEKDEVYPKENTITTPVGHRFKKDFIGLIPMLIMDINNKRNKYKKLMKDCQDKNSIEYKTYERLAYVFKFFSLSFYGVMGLKTSRFYDIRIAESTTLGGQFYTKMTAEYLESQEIKLLYGDTDSLFVTSDFNINTEQVIEDINEQCSEVTIERFNCAKSYLSIELDKIFQPLLLMKAKKRYAGYITFLDGKEVPKQLYVKGLEYSRTDSCKLLKSKQKELIQLLLDKKLDEASTRKYVLELRNYVLYNLNDIEEIKIAQKLTKEVEEYKTKTIHLKVVEELRKNGVQIYIGDKIDYYIASLDKEGKPIPKAARYFDGTFDRLYFWSNKLYPALERVLESVFPKTNWETYRDFGSAKKMANTKQGRMNLW